MKKEKIKVLIVEDSKVFQIILAKGLSSDENIKIIATVSNFLKVKDKIIKDQPDVMVCDSKILKVKEFEVIKELIKHNKLQVIITGDKDIGLCEVSNIGIINFISKPNPNLVKGVESFIYTMIRKIKVNLASKITLEEKKVNHKTTHSLGSNDNMIIAIGASTGGVEAIYYLLKRLSENLPGIVIVQHIPPEFSRTFANRLNNETSFQVKEAETGDYIQKGQVLIAPGDQHMKVIKKGGLYSVECLAGDKLNGYCPSVDILFESVAKEAGKNAIGIILTGMGSDGAKGLLMMKRKGARTIGQNEESCIVYGMPKVAFNIGAVEKQTSLSNIPYLLYSMLERRF